MRVAVYYNLHKKIFSIQSRETSDYGKVIAHQDSVVVAQPKFVVRQAGREKVLKENKKNVHAFVVGTLLEDKIITSSRPRLLSYNPYKNKTFVTADTKEEILTAELAKLWIHGQRPVMEAFQ
jgi:hypothetical protein